MILCLSIFIDDKLTVTECVCVWCEALISFINYFRLRSEKRD